MILKFDQQTVFVTLDYIPGFAVSVQSKEYRML